MKRAQEEAEINKKPELTNLMEDSVISYAKLDDVKSLKDLDGDGQEAVSDRAILEQKMLDSFYKAHPEKLPEAAVEQKTSTTDGQL